MFMGLLSHVLSLSVLLHFPLCITALKQSQIHLRPNDLITLHSINKTVKLSLADEVGVKYVN